MNTFYTIIGLLYAFAYKTAVTNFLSSPLRRWLKWGAWVMAIWAGWVWPRPVFAFAVSLLLLVYLFYWWAKRTGYSKFVVDKTAVFLPPDEAIAPLPANKQIPLRATGMFGTAHWETKLLLRPATYWQVPLGEHVVMVEYEKGAFVYQFFSAKGLQNVQQGVLLNGRYPHPTIAITYLSTWIPSNDLQFQMPNAPLPQNSKSRTIYFTFDDVEDEKLVWNNIVYNARQVRESTEKLKN